MAAATLTILPPLLLFLMAQKYFVQGITMSGLKG
jgi:multiple sugar transport system permease protein